MILLRIRVYPNILSTTVMAGSADRRKTTETVVLVIHGGSRDASSYFCALKNAVEKAGKQNTEIVAPRFM